MALPKSGFNDFSQSAASESGAAREGGGDMALALTSQVQSQANQMAIAAQAAQISIDAASDQLSDYFAGVMGGRALIETTLAKTAAKVEAQGGAININTDVPPVTLNLPSFGDFGETRQRFAGMFGGGSSDGYSPNNPFRQLAQAEAEALSTESGDE